MGKKANKEIRKDGYQPSVPSQYGYQPQKKNTRPNPPKTDTNVTKAKK